MTKTATQTPPKPLSYPKERIRVLLLENIHPTAIEAFNAEHYQIETVKGALTEDELIERLPGVHLLGIRSGTKVTARALEAADHLLAIGAFCIGTNQIDLPATTRHGVAVFNAPFSNTRSVVELAIGQIIMLMRHTFERSTEMHAGAWQKTAAGSFEVRGKKLGIVGYGNIGSQLSVLAESMGMEVMFFDLSDRLALGNARRADSLPELLGWSDIISLHVDGRPSNHFIIDANELALMKDSALLLNLSRGHVVNDGPLAEALRSGKLAGAGIDVFPAEPNSGHPFESPLRGLPNVILTPHIAGSTQEAQRDIGRFVSGKLISFINTGDTTLSFNLPNLQLPEQSGLHRIIHIHRNEPGVLAKINAVVASIGANITGQYLGTTPEVGYVITDIEKTHSQEVKSGLERLPETIKVRLLY